MFLHYEAELLLGVVPGIKLPEVRYVANKATTNSRIQVGEGVFYDMHCLCNTLRILFVITKPIYNNSTNSYWILIRIESLQLHCHFHHVGPCNSCKQFSKHVGLRVVLPIIFRFVL